MRSGGVLRNNYFIYTLPDQRMIKICRPRQGKQGLCCANLCRRSKGSAMPTCAGEARALLCRPVQEKQGLCYADLRRGSKGSAVPTCAGEAKALLCRPAQGKQRLCCADLRRGSKGSAVPTCGGFRDKPQLYAPRKSLPDWDSFHQQVRGGDNPA